MSRGALKAKKPFSAKGIEKEGGKEAVWGVVVALVALGAVKIFFSSREEKRCASPESHRGPTMATLNYTTIPLGAPRRKIEPRSSQRQVEIVFTKLSDAVEPILI